MLARQTLGFGSSVVPAPRRRAGANSMLSMHAATAACAACAGVTCSKTFLQAQNMFRCQGFFAQVVTRKATAQGGLGGSESHRKQVISPMQCIKQASNQSINQSINQSNNQTIKQSLCIYIIHMLLQMPHKLGSSCHVRPGFADSRMAGKGWVFSKGLRG